jgi:hypothetical protein
MCASPDEIGQTPGIVPVPRCGEQLVQIGQRKAAVRRQQPVREEQCSWCAGDNSHRELPGPAYPLVRQVLVQELGEVGRRDGRGESRAVVAKRLVVVSGQQTDGLRTLQDQLEDPQQRFQTEPAVVEQVAEEHDTRAAASASGLAGNQRERGLEREEVAVDVADEPERVGAARERQHAIGGAFPPVVEQHESTTLGVEQGFELLDRRPHARAHGRRLERAGNLLPVEVVHIDDGGNWRRRSGVSSFCRVVLRSVRCLWGVNAALRGNR